MRVSQYNAHSSRQLAAAVVTTARSPHAPDGPEARTTNTRVIDVGGGWLRSTWRDGLRQLTNRGAVTVIGIRAQPDEPSLSERDWRRVVREVVARAGIAGQPWAAARTGATTVAVLTEARGRPLRLDAARAYAETAGSRQAKAARWAEQASDGITTTALPASTPRAPTPGSVVHLNFAAPPAADTTVPTADAAFAKNSANRHTR